ncbi:A disintegrin and metalloproteinase with thrombospondin motifs 7-like isoform X1 [Lytechinus pictus]|uniref:A disintegrin and metalloproteinase with thrombospondin motifs 7-like isoform X1 n=1 Tax=Lytechinus pictus TaxID=7653 RepID=UPI0030B9B705
MRDTISSHLFLSMGLPHTSTQIHFSTIYRRLAMLTLKFLLILFYIQISHALTEHQQGDKHPSDFEIVHPRVVHDFDSRHRRSPSSSTSHHHKNLQYQFATKGAEFHLILTLNEGLISPDFVLERRSSSNVSRSRFQSAYQRHRHCSYHGVVRGHEKSQVAVNVCRGLRGLISLGGDNDFFIEPVNALVYNEVVDDGSHIIYKPSLNRGKTDQISNGSFCSHTGKLSLDEPASSTWRNRVRDRVRKSVSMERTVEALVVVDQSMVDYHKDEDIETYVLTIMNLVAKFYRDPSIGNLVNIALVRLILLEDEQDDLEISTDADITLNSFCAWQDTLNSERSEHQNHHDNAILLTRKNLCRGPDNSNACITVGLAHVSGMCNEKKSCSINEDTGLVVGFTVAHEMGHNLGMLHDGEENICDSSGPYVMAPRVPTGLTPTSWSFCSREYITRFLDSGRGSCLEDMPSSTPYNYPKVLPGVMYTADHQCRLQYGPNATVSPMFESDLCSTLWCVVGTMRKSRMIPAQQGTRCGKDKWCISGECIDIDEHPVVIDGGWGPWSEYSECSLTCGRAVKSKERHCNNPSPSHGGRYCVGERKKYTMCKLQDCDPQSVSVRAVQCSSYDSIQTNGTQLTWIPVELEEKPCALFCRRRDEAVVNKKSDQVANGTPCTRFSRDICIDGICQMVGCDNVVSSGAVEDRCGVCHGDGSSCLTIKDTFNTKYGREGYVEITTIPAGARNIVIEELVPSNNYLAISNDLGHDLLNMDWVIEWSGEYRAAGTIISYQRIDNKEQVEILGPLSEPIHIYLIFGRRVQNPGIAYQYTMARDVNQTAVLPQYFSWVYSDWSPCSASCGIGYQRSSVVCKELIAGMVDDRYCEGMKPDDMQQTCNEQQCPATWWEGPWQHCTGMCGEDGQKQRSVFCIRGALNGEQTVLDDNDCLSQGQEKPATEASCQVDHLLCESNDNWKTGEWSQCSVSCGEGWHTRSVICMNINRPCDDTGKPNDRRPCLLDQCPRGQYFYNPDPQAPENLSYADESLLDLSSASIYPSSDYAVNFGEWEKKKIASKKYESATNTTNLHPSLPPKEVPSRTIFELNITTHDVDVQDQDQTGSKMDQRPVMPDNPYINFVLFPSALNDKRPANQDATPGLHHRSQEPLIEWSKQPWQPCSMTCGDGIQQRIVDCIDINTGERTSGCSQEDQPISLQSCNLGSCSQVCRNTLSTTMCMVIVQSGSCSQAHFRERCCRTCSEFR